MKRAILFGALLGSCFFATSVAQAQSCDLFVGVGFGMPEPPGAYNCSVLGGTKVCSIHVANSGCPLPADAASGTSTGSCPSCSGGKPINFTTGNTYVIDGDLSVPGLGGGLSIGRTWNSIYPPSQAGPRETGMFGFHWTSNYEERIFTGSDNFVRYQRGDGSVWTFAYSTNGANGGLVYVTLAPSNDTTQLAFNGSNPMVMTFQSGEKRTFDPTSGMLLSIVDRNGNTTTLTYDTNNTRLLTVTDAAGRHLNFTYGTTQATYYLVQSVASPEAGISLSYTYAVPDGTHYQLTQVTKQDGKHVNYAYNAQNLITSVSDDHGVLESHTYDAQGRGLTSSRANGVDAVTVT